MKGRRTEQLFQILSEGGYSTADELAEKLGVSNKTIRNTIKELEKELEGTGAAVRVKYGSGYTLDCPEGEDVQELRRKLFSMEPTTYCPETPEERICYLAEYLFYTDGYVKMDTLSELMYVSKRVLSDDLKKVERIFSRHHLSIERKPGHGIRVEGEEFDKRLCIAELVTRRSGIIARDNRQELEQVSACIGNAFKKYDFEVNGIMLDSLIMHICIALERIRGGHYVEIPVNLEDYEKNETLYDKARLVAEEIVKELEAVFHIDFPESEIGYITIHLSGKADVEGALESGNLVISEEVNSVVLEMLRSVYDAFQVDFMDDLELRMSLCRHLVPLTIRLEHNINMRNPLLDDIKEKFTLAYAMALQASTVLNRASGKQMTDDETGYIALAFALALQRKQTGSPKKNILLVCASGRGSAQLLKYKCMEEFGRYVGKMEVCDVNQVPSVDFADIDYVFTTVPLQYHVPVPVREVQYFMGEKEVGDIRRLFCRADGVIEKYYSKELFIPSLRAENKWEVIQKMCSLAMEKRHLSEEFYESVVERERLAKTAFGNLVAMPHPYKAQPGDPFVCVAVLEHPILWEAGEGNGSEEEVQVVFLVSLEAGVGDEMEKFYDITSRLMLSPKYIQKLIRHRSFDQLVSSLKHMEDGEDEQ